MLTNTSPSLLSKGQLKWIIHHHQQPQCIHHIKHTEVLLRHDIIISPITSFIPSLVPVHAAHSGALHDYIPVTTHSCLPSLPNCVVITPVVVTTQVDPWPFSKFPNFHHFSVFKQLSPNSPLWLNISLPNYHIN